MGNLPQSLSYTALFGETYVVIPPIVWTSAGDEAVAKFTCQTKSCMNNEYNAYGKCNRCPKNHRANIGATSISHCWACPEGTYLSHPYAPQCSSSKVDQEEVTDSPTRSPVGGSTKAPTIKTLSPTKTPTKSPSENPTRSPTVSPTIQPSAKPVVSDTSKKCTEIGSAKFLLKIVNGIRPVKRPCSWLAQKGKQRQNRLCKQNEKFGAVPPAKDVCFDTCKSCDEESSREFLLKTILNDQGGRQAVVRTCEWLGKRNDRKIARFCRKSKTFGGFEPAKVVCPKTCSS